jgi:hypothetical protein
MYKIIFKNNAKVENENNKSQNLFKYDISSEIY